MKKNKSLLLRCIKLLTALAVLGATVFFAGAFWPLAITEVTSRPERLMFTNLALVDVESGRVITGQSILIENGQIAEIGSHISADDAQVVDGHGRYAIPGLFDMHAHSIKLAPSLTHPLFVAAGVTAIRGLGGLRGGQAPLESDGA